MPLQDFGSERLAAVETARFQTGVASRQGLSKQNVSAIVRKIDLLVDRAVAETQSRTVGAKVACAPGCNHCCYGVVFSTLPEVARVAEYIEEHFTEDQRHDLRERLYAYERAVAPSFGVNLRLVRTPCPLLVEGLCSAYEARPIHCRATNSTDPAKCEEGKLNPGKPVQIPVIQGQFELAFAHVTGMCEGLDRAGLDASPYDFARALKLALDDPAALDNLSKTANVFGPASPRQAPSNNAPINVPSVFPAYGPGEEPTGKIQPTDLAEAEYLALDKGDLDAAFKTLQGGHPVYKMWKLRVPFCYRSDEEVSSWRQRFATAVREFADSDFDPRQAFDAMAFTPAFGIAYHNRNDRDLLSEYGQMLVDKITAKALPDLCQPIDAAGRSGKIKVGYISANLRNSNGGRWALGWLKNHADDIETYAFNLGPSEDHVSEQFKAHAGRYFHLTGNVPRDARFIKSLNLDVLIYTDIGMEGVNYQFASMRLAPVQCTAWGHPVTSGLPTIDYYLSSDLMEPENAQEHYRERLVRLPNSGLCYSAIAYEASNLVKADFGLDDGPLILSCQNPMKYHPSWDHLYKEINERTGRPIVFLDWQSSCGQQIVWKRMQDAGINAKIVPGLGGYDFLGLLRLADVSLDPPAWNGGNTTIEALSFQTPVVTLPGEFMRGRHSLAFLQIAGVPGLIAKDANDYVDLATNPSRRNVAMHGLNTAALFDDLSPVQALDDFFRTVATR